MSRVLDESGQKLIRIKILKEFPAQPDPNPWWTGLARGFQSILTTLLRVYVILTGLMQGKLTCVYIYLFIILMVWIW